MWHALSAELGYLRGFMVGASLIALAAAGMVNLLVWSGAGEGPPPFITSGLPSLGMIIGAMVVGFIAQGTRSEERRMRLLLAGPITPRRLGAVMLIIPIVIMGLGFAAAALIMSAVAWWRGGLDPESLRVVLGVGGQLFAILLLGPLAQESSAARRQRRGPSSLAGWALFAAAILSLLACQWYLHTILGHLAQLAIAAVVMAASYSLFVRRTDFTR